MTEIRLNGQTYNLEGMSDAEIAAWLKQRAATDAVMERLSAKYSPDEMAMLGTEQIGDEIQGMDGLLISVQPEQFEPSPEPQPSPIGILTKLNQRKK